MASPPPEHFDVRVARGLTDVTFTTPSLDDSNLKAIAERLYDLVEQHRPARLRLDFGRVELLTSTFLGKLLGLHRRVSAAGGKLALDNVRPPVYEVFESTGLTFFLDVKKGEA
jgi:anti-anti-sigma factor